MKLDTRIVVSWLLVLVPLHGGLAIGNHSVKCRENERLSLLSLKRGFVDPHGSLSSWGSGENRTDCCKWDGVSCDIRTGHVVGLYLGSFSEGTLSPSLAKLHHLTSLSLASNNFTPSQFPTSILSLKKLQHLDLSQTNLIGNLPHSFPLCNLTELDLGGNSLSGQLDDFVASFNHCPTIPLKKLRLSDNRLTGSVPNLSKFSSLEYLYLSNNQLNGTINDGIGLLSKLTDIDISRNFLQGFISETHFLRLSMLETLDLSFNKDLAFNISHDWIPPFQLYYIHLASCKLGPAFPTWLRTQNDCVQLDISNAEISDTMPSYFLELACAEMNFSHNQISGEIQNSPVKETLGFIDLSSNLLEGSIPANLSRKTQTLMDLSNNRFIDASTFLCPNETVYLSMLDLSSNRLSGVLPNCWKYFESLVFLDVTNNGLFGKIPTSMGSLINIESLHLGLNKFSGELPLSLNNCTELVVFDVHRNNFSGMIPSWIGNGFKKIRILILRSNKFSGSLTPNICILSQLQILDLSMNNISGNLPKCLNHLSGLVNQTKFVEPTITYSGGTQTYSFRFPSPLNDTISLVWKGKESKYQSILGLVKSIDLSSNMLKGEIPNEMMDLLGLVSLNISRNMLSGQIPTTIGQLKLLDFLDLSRNHLSGHIPNELSQIDRLGVMDLSYNNLSGEIPLGTQLQSFDPSTYEGNAHLCGVPLPKCPTRSTQDHPNDEDFEEDDQFFSRGFFISLSIGFGTGFWGICSLIFLNKSFRYAFFRLMSDIYDKVYVVIAINVATLRR